MTANANETRPPEGYETWLDYWLAEATAPNYGAATYARAELAALRARIAELEAKPEPPTDYAMALDSLRDALARIAELEEENDELKSRLAEMERRWRRMGNDELDEVRRHRDELEVELAEWKAAFGLDDHEGDSRLMATAMGQALKEAIRERDEWKQLFAQAYYAVAGFSPRHERKEDLIGDVVQLRDEWKQGIADALANPQEARS